MKILYITLENLSFHKGSVVHVKEIVNGLRKLGHRVGLVASSLNKSEEADRFYNLNVMTFLMLRLFRLKKQPYIVSSIFLFLYLLRILPQYDMIYARDYHTVIIALFPRLIFNKKLIFEVNGIANEEIRLKDRSFLDRSLAFLIKRAEKMAARYSDRIVSVTPQIAAYLTRDFHCCPEKVEVIANGVNTEKFHPIYDETLLSKWKQKLGIAKEEIVVAFIGNLAPWQGLDTLIDSAPGILSRKEKLKFLVVGEGLQKPDLMKKTLDSGFNNNFVFTGMVDYGDIPFLINIADVCVAPFISRRNQKTGVSPLKIFEYSACGKPVIASRIEGLEFVETEGIGLLTEPEDAIAFGEALWELLEDPQKRIEMGRRGLRIARERFDWAKKVAQTERLLKGLV